MNHNHTEPNDEAHEPRVIYANDGTRFDESAYPTYQDMLEALVEYNQGLL